MKEKTRFKYLTAEKKERYEENTTRNIQMSTIYAIFYIICDVIIVMYNKNCYHLNRNPVGDGLLHIANRNFSAAKMWAMT